MNEFTDEKLKEFGKAFELFDKHKKNLLSKEEADSAFKCLGYNFSEEEMLSIFDEYGTGSNKESNNMISFINFVNFLGKRSKESDLEDELMEAFQSFDRDGDGKLNSKELKYLLLTLGERLEDEEIEEIIREIDTSGEGVIRYKDFVHIMMEK